ncbi:MAG: hypothetical protein Q8N98_04100 [bacterium]|nr:hypothetical protein [bacterium]
MATKAEGRDGCGRFLLPVLGFIDRRKGHTTVEAFLQGRTLGSIPDEVRAYLRNPETTAEVLIRDKMLPLAVKSPVGPPESIHFRYKIGRIFDEWVGRDGTARRFDLINALAVYPNMWNGVPDRGKEAQDMEFAIGQLLENCGFPEELIEFLGQYEENMAKRSEEETRLVFDRVACAIWSKVVIGEEHFASADLHRQEEARDITLVACSYPPDYPGISTPAKKYLAEALLRQTPEGHEDEIGENILWYGLGGCNEGKRAGRVLLDRLNIRGSTSTAEWLVAKIAETPLDHDSQRIWSELATTVILGYESRHLLCAALVEKIGGITDADDISQIASVCRGLDAIVCAPEGAITEETAETLIGVVLDRLSQSLAVAGGEFVHHIPMLRLAGALAERCSERGRTEMRARVMAIVSNLHPTGRQAARKLERTFGIEPTEPGEVSSKVFTQRLHRLWGYKDEDLQ